MARMRMRFLLLPRLKSKKYFYETMWMKMSPPIPLLLQQAQQLSLKTLTAIRNET